MSVLGEASVADLDPEYVAYFGLDPERDRELLWVVADSSSAPLPLSYAQRIDKASNRPYFYLKGAKKPVPTWTHPSDVFYKTLAQKLKAARDRIDAEIALETTGGLSPEPALTKLQRERAVLVDLPSVVKDLLALCLFLGVDCFRDPASVWVPLLCLSSPLPDGWEEREREVEPEEGSDSHGLDVEDLDAPVE
ncbi:hypothetical protein KIPB_013601, partial [Kipferlia bialata]|eukprot:g13601.t1